MKKKNRNESLFKIKLRDTCSFTLVLPMFVYQYEIIYNFLDALTQFFDKFRLVLVTRVSLLPFVRLVPDGNYRHHRKIGHLHPHQHHRHHRLLSGHHC